MGLRCFSFETLMVFLLGGSQSDIPPPLPPTVIVGPQPVGDKDANFAPVVGGYVAYEGPALPDLGVAVDEKTQTF